MCDKRSPAEERALTRLASFLTTPETTLKYDTRPEKGSATVLKTKAETGRESFTGRSASLPLSVPFHGPRSAGLGKFSSMKFRIKSLATLWRPEAHSTG